MLPKTTPGTSACMLLQAETLMHQIVPKSAFALHNSQSQKRSDGSIRTVSPDLIVPEQIKPE